MSKVRTRWLVLALLCVAVAAFSTIGRAEAPAAPPEPGPKVLDYDETLGPQRPDRARTVVLTPVARDGTPVGPSRPVRLTPVPAGDQPER
jgi:hypothetical protein